MTDTLTQPAAPLSLFSPADGELEVVEIQGQDGSSRRMCELGICPGKRLRVVRSGDPALLAVAGSRFALARDLTSRVFVRPVA
ncbi:MAG: ferrous iron transport protein A [Planctomycetes bacterium]|nr:ferrous iron transport protein A [Planctomycetota bacterium]MCL4729448.1 FeoA domain-containing protein [Planctomycetota bacterium]